MRHVLAWDLGTSGAKAGLVTAEGQVLGVEFEPTRVVLLPGGGAEQSPDDWWRALVTATQRLLSRQLVPRASIAAVGVTAQWSGTVAVDRAGEPLHPAVIWMESRGAQRSRQIAGGMLRIAGYGPLRLQRWIRLTGGAPASSGKDSLSHILWFQSELPRIYEQTFKFLEPKDYLAYRLSGRFAASFDSIALHWVTDNRNPDAVRYDAGLIELCGLDREKLPDLCPALEVLGPLRREHAETFGLSPETIVVSGAPDVHSAAIGSGATRDFEAHLYVGTSSWIACHLPAKKTSVIDNMAALPAPLPGRYLLMNEQESAGACLVHLRDKLFFAQDELSTGPAPAEPFAAFDRVAASSPPGSRGLIFLPWLYGERTPVEDRRLRGGFVNYSLVHERSDVVRSVLEGVAMNSRWLFGRVEALVGRPIPELRFIGGGAKSDLWAGIFADVLGRPVLPIQQPLASNLRGAALIALVALGELAFEEVPARIRPTGRFEPRRDTAALYDERFQEFLALHRALKPTFDRMND
jgi:xylulokinase